jgi:alpha-D-xyloside xylohydrolase
MNENATGRSVYLPAGGWIDYQSGKSYSGGWHTIEAGTIPAVILVREGAVIPQIKLAQSTMQLDWSHLDLAVFAKESDTANGLVCLPSDNVLRGVSLKKSGGKFEWSTNPPGNVSWNILQNP